MHQKTPCSDCPFKKNSLKGYAGPHEDAQEIVNIVWADQKFPCHVKAYHISHTLEHDGLEPDEAFEEALEEAPVCAGAAALLSNSCKLSRHPEVRTAQKIVGRRNDIFANPRDMVDYHDTEMAKRIRAEIKNSGLNEI